MTETPLHAAPMGPAPPITIGMPVFKAERFLRDAVRSILDQTYGEFRLVISDNGSSDLTRIVCRELAEEDPRILYVRHPQTRAGAWNFSHTFDYCRSPYFIWAADDDIWHPRLLEATKRALERAPDAVLACSRARAIDDDGTLLVGGLRPPPQLSSPSRVVRISGLLRSGYFSYIYGLIRSDALRRTRVMRTVFASDQRLLMELLLLGRFSVVPEELFFVRFGVKDEERLRSAFADPDAITRRAVYGYLAHLRGLVEDVRRWPIAAWERAAIVTSLLVGMRRPVVGPLLYDQSAAIFDMLLGEIPADLRANRWATAGRKSLLALWLRPAAAVGSAGTALRSALESPRFPGMGAGVEPQHDGASSSRAVMVSGWALAHEGRVARVEAHVAGADPVPARIGLPRPDLAGLRRRPEAGLAGVEALVVADPPQVEVRFRVDDGAGSVATDPVPYRLAPAGSEGASSVAAPLVRGCERLLVVPGHIRDEAAWHHAERVVGALGSDAEYHAFGDGPRRDELEASGGTVSALPSPPVDHPQRYDDWLSERVASLRRARADAVLVESLPSFGMVEAAARAGIPAIWVLQERELPPACWYGLGRDEWVADRARAALDAASVVVFASPGTRDRFGELVSRERAAVIPPAVTASEAPGPLGDGEPLSVVCPLPPVEDSCLPMAVFAFRTIASAHPRVRFLLPQREDHVGISLRRFAEEVGLRDRILFLDAATLWSAAGSADLVIDPSDRSLTPLEVLGLIASGRPTVTAATPDLEGMLRDRTSAYLYPWRDPVGLAEAISRGLSDDPSARQRLARAGADAVLARHDPEREATAWRDLVFEGRVPAAG